MRCVLASGNAKKAKELTELLAPKGWQVSLQSELGVAQPAEDGLTFVENALIKARAASEQTGLPAIADDSGLVVPALQGAPGIYSARFAGETASDAENNTKLLSVMHDLVDEQLNFTNQCTLFGVHLLHISLRTFGLFPSLNTSISKTNLAVRTRTNTDVVTKLPIIEVMRTRFVLTCTPCRHFITVKTSCQQMLL